jgi:hypothetical protein
MNGDEDQPPPPPPQKSDPPPDDPMKLPPIKPGSDRRDVSEPGDGATGQGSGRFHKRDRRQ